MPFLFEWRDAVAGPNGPRSSTTRHVLLTLALHMDMNGGACFPSTATLSERTALSERSVCTHLDRAEEEGWIRRSRHRGKGQSWARTEYVAVMPEALKEVQHLPERGTERGSVPSAPKTRNSGKALKEVQYVKGEGTEPHDKKALKEVQSNSSVNSPDSLVPKQGPEQLSAFLDPDTRRGVYSQPFEELWAEYPRNPNDSKKAAWGKYKARIRAGITHQELIEGVRRYAGYVDAVGTEPQFVKHLKTFLGPDEHWRLPWSHSTNGKNHRDPRMVTAEQLREREGA